MATTRRAALLSIGLAAATVLSAQSASAPASSADITGRWQFSFQTEGGPRSYEADLKTDGKAVTGTWNKKAEVKGTFSNGQLDLEFPESSDEVGDGTLKILGKLSDGLTGSWSFQSYAGTFKAVRIKE